MFDRAFTNSFNLFEERFWEDLFKPFYGENKKSYVTYSFPPTDVFVDENKNLNFRFALAGYDDESLDISFSGDTMILKVKNVNEFESDKEKSFKFLSRGIKRGGCLNRYYVPSQAYNVENAKATFVNGILSIHVPAKEVEKPLKIEIGKKPLKIKSE